MNRFVLDTWTSAWGDIARTWDEPLSSCPIILAIWTIAYVGQSSVVGLDLPVAGSLCRRQPVPGLSVIPCERRRWDTGVLG